MKTESEKQLAEIVCQAWNELDASLLEPILCDDFEFISVWVLETMKGKERYLNYISGKFEAIRMGDRPVSAEVVYQDCIDKYVIVLNQGGNLAALEPTIEGNMLKSLWMRPPGLTLPAVFTTQKPAGGTPITKEEHDVHSIMMDEVWEDDDYERELEECGKPKPLKDDTDICPFCGYRLKPVYWGEITPEIVQKKKDRKIYIGEELYGRDSDSDKDVVHPEYACGNCGESFYKEKE